MKKLKVPYLKTLDALHLSSIGSLMEEKGHRESIDVVNWPEYAYKPIVSFDIARGDQDLYIRYFVRGNALKASHSVDGSPVHQDSCVEFFMKKPGDDTYMNFEFNCIGVCDAARRKSKTEKVGLNENEYRMIRRYSTAGRDTFDEKKGLYTWELVVAIPFSLMGLSTDILPEKINANFYKCADDTAYPHFVSWNAIDNPTPNFHLPEFFGEIYF